MGLGVSGIVDTGGEREGSDTGKGALPLQHRDLEEIQVGWGETFRRPFCVGTILQPEKENTNEDIR